MISTIARYNLIAGRMDNWLHATGAEPTVAREVANYLERIPSIKSVEQFIADDRVYRFAMKAFGLSDMIYAKAFMRKVLTEGADSSTAFANKLSDRRYAAFAAAFNFKRYGETTTIFERTRQGTVDKFVRATLEENAGTANQNVRLALYFERTAPTISSAYSILADKALTKVVYTALGLSDATSLMDVDAQAQLISSRLVLTDLHDPAKLSKFITRFAAQADAASDVVAENPAVSILASQGTIGLDASALLTIQSARRG